MDRDGSHFSKDRAGDKGHGYPSRKVTTEKVDATKRKGYQATRKQAKDRRDKVPGHQHLHLTWFQSIW